MFKRYIKLRLASGISQTTLDSELKCHKALWAFLGVNDPLKITKSQILKYAEHITSYTYADNTKHQRIKGLNSFYSEAVKQGWLLMSPMAGIRYPKKTETLPKVLSIEQTKLFLNMPDLTTKNGIRDRTCFELAYSCGLRANELLSVTDAMFSENYTRLRLMRKGNKEVVLPVTRMSAYFLRYYISNVFPILNKLKQDKLFISTTTGKPLWDSSLRAIYASYGKMIGLKVSTHTLRYSICSHLSDEGVDIRLLQVFMSHDSLETTSRYIKQNFHKMQAIHKQKHPRENG